MGQFTTSDGWIRTNEQIFVWKYLHNKIVFHPSALWEDKGLMEIFFYLERVKKSYTHMHKWQRLRNICQKVNRIRQRYWYWKPLTGIDLDGFIASKKQSINLYDNRREGL